MSCCDDTPVNTSLTVDMRDLPEETFCCLGRTAYMVAHAALQIAAGKENPTWDSLNERQKLEFCATAKAFVVGDREGNSELEKVMVVVLRTMTTAI